MMGELLEHSFDIGKDSSGNAYGSFEACFKVDDAIYSLEYKKEGNTDENDIFWEVTMKMDPEKKLLMTPNDLPWSDDGRVEIRVTGFE